VGVAVFLLRSGLSGPWFGTLSRVIFAHGNRIAQVRGGGSCVNTAFLIHEPTPATRQDETSPYGTEHPYAAVRFKVRCSALTRPSADIVATGAVTQRRPTDLCSFVNMGTSHLRVGLSKPGSAPRFDRTVVTQFDRGGLNRACLRRSRLQRFRVILQPGVGLRFGPPRRMLP
jgi:hypothetical protein